MISTEIKLHGFKELDEALKQLPRDVEKRINRKALREGAKIFQKEVQRLAPTGMKGRLKRTGGIVIKSKTQRTKTAMGWKSGGYFLSVVAGKKSFYAHMLEFGTKPHWIYPKKAGGMLAIPRPGGKIEFTKSIYHPGSRKFPFFGPAFDNKRYEVIKVYGDIMEKEIRKQFKKRNMGPITFGTRSI